MSATPRGGSAVSASSFPSSGFFSHHGPWAPGVRLFRQLGFRSKALIVSTCFVVPLVVVSTSWFSNEMADLDFTRREADGTRFGDWEMDTIVDPTVIGLGRYIPRIARVAAQTELQIVVATGSLKVRLIVGLRPNKQPVASVCDMAFHASRPLAFEPMHIMPANKF